LALPASFKKSFPLLLILLACASAGRNAPPMTPADSREILNLRETGSLGPEIGNLGKLIEPASLLINNIGEIFIADRAVNAIFKLSSDLTPLAREGGLGGFGGGFNRPLGMASDAALNIYIADGGNRRIQILDRDMRFVKAIDSYEDQSGEIVSFVFPTDVAIDPEGNIWVADEDRVLKLDPFFKLLFEASEKGAGYFLLGRVTSIEISRAGTIAIADAGNNRFIIMSTYGNYFGEITSGAAAVVTWDNDNNIWAIEPDNGRTSCFDINGRRLYTYSDSGGSRPVWIAVDRDGRLLILDRNQRRLKTYDIIRGNHSPNND
jgi:DNA-binding beta-propeller fold protein YncE